MHTNPHENVEDEAWEFAAEFLMPSAEIEKQLDGINLDKLGQLKKDWGVSMQAILYRAKKLGKIGESYYRFPSCKLENVVIALTSRMRI